MSSLPGYRQWWKCDLVVARNFCMARMLPGEAELVSESIGLPGRAKGVHRYERSDGLDTTLYINYIYLYLLMIFITIPVTPDDGRSPRRRSEKKC